MSLFVPEVGRLYALMLHQLPTDSDFWFLTANEFPLLSTRCIDTMTTH